MTCQEVHNLLGLAIDGGLPNGPAAEFHDHLTLCGPCRTALELESIAKRIVRQKIKRVPTPPQVFEAVVRTLGVEQEDSTEAGGILGWFVRDRYVVPIMVAGLATIVMIALLIPAKPADLLTQHNAPNDVINQSIINFALVRSGDLKPTMVSCYPEGVVAFFERNGVRFTVKVKTLENCEWYGASSSDYNGVKLAHVVYKIGNDWMYVYQVGENDVKDGAALHLPAAAQKSLAANNWYTDPDHPDCNVVVWRDHGTLCSAVSTMKKDRLLALLTAK